MFYRFWKTKQDLSVPTKQDLSVPALADKVVLKGKKRFSRFLFHMSVFLKMLALAHQTFVFSVTDDPSIPTNITFTNVLLRAV